MSKNNDNLYCNSEGYKDPTPYPTLKKEQEEEQKLHKLIKTIYWICDIAGYYIEERVVLRDKNSGKIWR